jgi:hypothetical protein
MSNPARRILDILEYWHKVEFFIPFDLKQVLDTPDEWTVKWLNAQDQQHRQNPSLWEMPVPEDRVLSGFKLFLGVFDMSAIAEFAQCLAPAERTDAFEDTERTELEGPSCFASIRLDAHGQPMFDRVSVSTAPWALGQGKQHGLSLLNADAFSSARQRLAQTLDNFRSARIQQRGDDVDENSPVPLSVEEVLELHQIFVEWTGYAPPADKPVALVQVLTRAAPKKRGEPGVGNSDAARSASDTDTSALPEDTDDDDSEGVDEDVPTIDILNSFYIEDIESCMAAIARGDTPATLDSYLTPLETSRRVDLYTDAGCRAIVTALHPNKFNVGHWLEDDSRQMSLMQQFAINSALESLRDGGIFSVNGPPGTGKTTLLREVVCENVVKRARRLAALTHARDAFTNTRIKVGFRSDSTSIRELRPEFTGFEMVVASSNNAAVENISNDLPKRKQLGEAWTDARYLQPVAHKIASQKDDGSFAKLESGDVPWGLISCALGRGENRRRFTQRFYQGDSSSVADANRDRPQHIRDWYGEYAGINFVEAKHAFMVADAALQVAIGERASYADLHAELLEITKEGFLERAQAGVDSAEIGVYRAKRAKEGLDSERDARNSRLAELSEEERLIDRTEPGFLARLFRTAAARRHAAEVASNAHAQRQILTELAQLKEEARVAADHLLRADMQLDEARAELEEKSAAWAHKQATLNVFRERFPAIALPDSLNALETDDVQKQGMWQDRDFARLRSSLFAAALTLHEAWIAEVARKGGPGFGGNLFAINRLLSGSLPDDPSHVPLIWQSLFMIVPVVSTTFASFSRQFQHMGAGSIGWLFIDEAGQAVPQAAVGALWRAQRALIVGDPLQIEPVFTVPIGLINALASQSPSTEGGDYSPARTSVQRLADDANQYGTSVPVDGDEPLWIGSPLRVHRRCVDPMFSIANLIAYQDKMVFGLNSREPGCDDLNLGKSAWINVGGKTSFRQVVPRQVEVVIELIKKLFARDGVLPSLYVISPFKAIKNELSRQFLAVDWVGLFGRRPPTKKALRDWCKSRIGTVHTFQGKEEKVVIFVLGTDDDSKRAANWAASKPNLLNVALTRAQQRFYVVGDAALWGGLSNFEDALAQLEIITADAWLARCDVAVV